MLRYALSGFPGSAKISFSSIFPKLVGFPGFTEIPLKNSLSPSSFNALKIKSFSLPPTPPVVIITS
jgi:hypothetical protein